MATKVFSLDVEYNSKTIVVNGTLQGRTVTVEEVGEVVVDEGPGRDRFCAWWSTQAIEAFMAKHGETIRKEARKVAVKALIPSTATMEWDIDTPEASLEDFWEGVKRQDKANLSATDTRMLAFAKRVKARGTRSPSYHVQRLTRHMALWDWDHVSTRRVLNLLTCTTKDLIDLLTDEVYRPASTQAFKAVEAILKEYRAEAEAALGAIQEVCASGYTVQAMKSLNTSLMDQKRYVESTRVEHELRGMEARWMEARTTYIGYSGGPKAPWVVGDWIYDHLSMATLRIDATMKV